MVRKITLLATKLRKFKYDGTSSNRPSAAAEKSASEDPGQTSPTTRKQHAAMETDALKSEILSSLRADIGSIIREEMKNVLSEDFNHLKSELHAIRAELANNTAAIHSEMDQVKANIKEVEGGLTTWSGEMVVMQNEVSKFKTQVEELKEKYDDLEGRMRRGNVRIAGLAEKPGASSATAVSKLLREVLQMDRDLQVDRTHRSLAPKRSDGRPRVIIAKMHHDQDCMDILKRARERAPLRLGGEQISIYPDFTTNVAQARAAFNDVKKTLRGRQGVRYGLLFPAKLRITFNGEDRLFLKPAEAMDYVNRNITPASAAENGE